MSDEVQEVPGVQSTQSAQGAQAPQQESTEAISMKQLLEAGVHFGHQISHWNPRMKQYIFGNRNGIHIIDLQQTVTLSKDAFAYIKQVISDGGEILVVGTKKQAQGIVEEEAVRSDIHYVNSRWLGGTLTNFNTIRSRVDYLLELKKNGRRRAYGVTAQKRSQEPQKRDTKTRVPAKRHYKDEKDS